jgi:hypothetical protein
MPAKKKLPMRQVGDVLRLKHACGMRDRVIARSLGLGRTMVGEYLRRASGAGLGWPLPAGAERRRSRATAVPRRGRTRTAPALTFFGDVPKIIVPATSRPGSARPEPGLNRTYADMAVHYGAAIVLGRSPKPRDKAKVEVAVQLVERWILARLRPAASSPWPTCSRVLVSYKSVTNTFTDTFAETDRPGHDPMAERKHARGLLLMA